jgi:hypothetical protein
MADIETPPPHLLKKFSTEARDESNKRNGAGYLKSFARRCIEWASSKSTSNLSQIRSSEIVPPPELVQQWWAEENYDPFGVAVSNLANHAAQWGADQELEACCEWIYKLMDRGLEWSMDLREARRPKPPSLKEQAIAALHGIHDQGPTPEQVVTIRRALEALDD